MYDCEPYLDLSGEKNDAPCINMLGYVGVGGQKGFIYSVNGICPCLPATQWKDATKVVVYE